MTARKNLVLAAALALLVSACAPTQSVKPMTEDEKKAMTDAEMEKELDRAEAETKRVE